MNWDWDSPHSVSAGCLMTKPSHAAPTLALGTLGARPILKWAGGKSGLITQLRGHFPKVSERYFEPFFGGGAVFFAFAAQMARHAVLADRNPELIHLYSVARDRPADLMAALDGMAQLYSEDYYYQVRGQTPEDSVQRAARTVFLNKTGFNGLYRQNAAGRFNVPFGKRVSCPALYKRDNLLAVSGMLGSAKLVVSDFAEVLAQAGEGDTVYCDPPYEPSSATSNFSAYLGGGFSREDQVRLRDSCFAAAARGALVLISNSAAPFIREIYAGCLVHTVKARRAINSKASGRGELDELVIVLPPRQA